MNMYVSKYKYILVLILIGIVTHLQWFNPFSTLTFSDWSYWPNEAVKGLHSSWGTWINFFNFGSVNIQIPFLFFNSIWSLVIKLGGNYDLATKITFFMPIALLGFISPFFLFRKLFKNEFIAFLVSLFYGTTTCFIIRQIGHLPIAFVYSITPLILLSFIYAFEKEELKRWIIFTLLFFLGICYEVRIMYIVLFILFFYFMLFEIKKIRFLIAPIIIIMLLSLFWILPIFFGGGYEDIRLVANRGLFGNFLFSLNQAFTIFESSWTGGYPNMDFVNQPIILYFWIFPIIAFLVLLISNRKAPFKKEILFFSLISLLGIFLTKQSAPPFTSFYLWAYNNFLGFNLFREASKFYLFTALGYTGLIGYGLLFFKERLNKRTFFYILIALVIVFCAYNAKPLITGEIRTLFVSREIPQDYLILKPFILNQPEYFRTLWTPVYSRFGIFENLHPKISNVDVLEGKWPNFKDKDAKPYDWENQIKYLFNLNFSDNLLDVSSVKFVIIPLRDTANDDDFFRNYGNSTEFYINLLENQTYLKSIDIGTKEVKIYENEGYLSHIYGSTINQSLEDLNKSEIFEIKHEQINPTEYKISFTGEEPFYLYFSDAYHSQWKIADGNFKWYKGFSDKSYIFDNSHAQAYGFLNGWYVDPSKLNKDQNGEYELTIYFKPQSYFYLGLIISGITFICCIGYLIYDFIKGRKSRKLRKENK